MVKEDVSTAGLSGLPGNLKAGLERLSGVELSDVKVHRNSDKPQQVGALAYTKGNDIHIAPGQVKYLPHEGWHAVQQKQGMVKPTLQMITGEPINDDAGLEKEADVMGNRAEEEGSTGRTAKTVNLGKSFQMRQESKTIQRISQEEAMRIAKENTHEDNSGYSWSIQAGEYNRYVIEAQDMLRDIGYNLSKRGVDGKWSPGGETYNALLKFQKNCQDTYNGLRQNAPPQALAQVKYMQGVEPTGKLDKATYYSLKKEKENKIIRIKGENERANKKKKVLESSKARRAAVQGNLDTDDVLDGIQTAIDVAGFVPGAGDIADGVNVGISIVRRDWLGAIFSGIALIPVVGSAIAAPIKAITKASKVGKAGKLSKIVTNAIEFLVKFLGGANKVISKLSGYLEDLKGILRKLPEGIKAVAESKLVKFIAGNIFSFAKKIGNGIDTICKKVDEVFIKVKNAISPETTVKEAVEAERLALPSAKKYTTAIEGKVSPIQQQELPSRLAKTFTDSNYRTVVTNENTTLYRVFGGNSDAGGAMTTTIPSANRIQAKIDSALLPEWGGSKMYEATIIVPKGQVLNIGKVAPQTIKSTGTVLQGGADQILLPQNWPLEWIKDISTLPSR